LTSDEMSVFKSNIGTLPNGSPSFLNFERIGFNSKSGNFSKTEIKFDSFDTVNEVNLAIFQLTESLILKGSTNTNGVNNYTIINKNFNVLKKLTWDSSETIFAAGLLNDGRIIVVSQKGVFINVNCLKPDYNLDWKKTIGNTNSYGKYINDLIITNESIFIQTSSDFNSTISYLIKLNFTSLSQVNRQIKSQGKYTFKNMEESGNGIVLSGQKYNAVSGLLDLCFLNYNYDLQITNETIINIADNFPDWDMDNIKQYWDVTAYFSTLLKDETGYWMAATYPNFKNTYSLKLLKFNKQMHLEKIIPILTNLDDHYLSTQLKMDANYIYVTYANTNSNSGDGFYFFLLNKNGEFIN
jgi:hypothetical protein